MGWKKGDTVKLKSGGPLMTVNDTSEEDGTVECKWFVAGYELKQDWFSVDALEAAKSQKG